MSYYECNTYDIFKNFEQVIGMSGTFNYVPFKITGGNIKLSDYNEKESI